jgi:Family of unknown function (DUF6893)
MNARIGGLAAMAAVVGALAWQWPEIQRYLKVKKM